MQSCGVYSCNLWRWFSEGTIVVPPVPGSWGSSISEQPSPKLPGHSHRCEKHERSVRLWHNRARIRNGFTMDERLDLCELEDDSRQPRLAPTLVLQKLVQGFSCRPITVIVLSINPKSHRTAGIVGALLLSGAGRGAVRRNAHLVQGS